MALVETCIILKWAGTPQAQVEQDLTPWYDAVSSSFVSQTYANKSGSKLRLRIPTYLQGDGGSTPAFIIDNFQEVWVGIRDGTTWQSVRFGGYIGSFTEAKVGGDQVFDIDLLSYNFDLETTAVTSWPRDITRFIPVETPGDDALLGYPPSYVERDDPDLARTATEWLIGTVGGGFPYDGVLPFFTQNVDIEQGVGMARSVDGVEDIHFSYGLKPSNTELPGFFAATTLDNVIKEILKAASYIAADPAGLNTPKNLVYWMKAVVDTTDATRIRPKFMVRDLNDLGSVVLTFNDNATQSEGEYRYENFRKSVDPTATRGGVPLFGLGSEITGSGALAEYKLIYNYDESNLSRYPAPYHLPRTGFTWGSFEAEPIVEPKLTTQAQANILAPTLAAAAGRTRRTISFDCDVAVEEGTLIQFSSHAPYFNDSVPVIRVTQTGTPGRTVYHVEAGWVKPTPAEIMNDNTVDLITLRHPGPLDTYLYYTAGTAIPETTSSRSINATPDGSQRNVAQSLHDHVVTGHLLPAQNRTNSMANGLPVDPDGLVPPLMAATGDVPVPQPLPAVAPMPTSVAWGTVPGSNLLIPQAWFDANNNVHPIKWSRDFTSDGWQPVTLPAPAAITTAIFMVEYNEDATVYADFVRGGFTGGMTLTLKRTLFSARLGGSAGDVLTVSADAVTAAAPLLVDYGMSLTVHVAGLPDGHWVKVYLSEEKPDASVFGGPPTVTP